MNERMKQISFGSKTEFWETYSKCSVGIYIVYENVLNLCNQFNLYCI